MHPRKREGLPEVGQVVQRIAAVDEVDRLRRVLVGQESPQDTLDVLMPPRPDLRFEPRQHHGRDVDGDDLPAVSCRGERELPSPDSHVQHHEVPSIPRSRSSCTSAAGAAVHLAVVLGHVLGVEVLSPGVREFIENPAPDPWFTS